MSTNKGLSQQQHTKRKTIIIVILIISILFLFLVFLGGLAFFLFENGDSSTKTETIIQEEETP